MEGIGLAWNIIISRPMVNLLIIIYVLFLNNFGLAIVVFTVLMRLLTLPLTLKQLRSFKAMSALQPKLAEIRKKYAKDRERRSQEEMKLMREARVNPLGCLTPMLIQFPIWIGLYQAIIQVLPPYPEGLIGLAQKLYPWLSQVREAIPLNSGFLWLNLALPDRTPVLPILTGASMWVQQKMTTMPSSDPRQASTNKMMLWMMPAMFALFTFSFPSGLALYWVVSNVIGIVIQYFVTGWGPLFNRPGPVAVTTPVSPEKKESHGEPGDERQDRRRSHRDRPQGARRGTQRGGGGGPKQRKGGDTGLGRRAGPGPGGSAPQD